MAGWKDFREIAAWQHSEKAKIRVYTLLERPGITRDFRLATQLREAARSAPANIAEGFGRFGNKEFARFARIAKGSLHESMNHLIDAKDQRLITEDELLIEEHHIKKANQCRNWSDPPFGNNARTRNQEPNRTKLGTRNR